MGLDVGMVVTGKVTGIKKFGAFVTLEDKKSGLVHISEIASTYVDDVSTHLTEGQEVLVKVIGIDETGRINLSIKKAQEPERPERPDRPERSAPPPRPHRQPNPPQEKGPASFEDRLKQFMQESNNKISGLEMYAGKKKNRRARD
ncbi:MAG: S1 RNA-binding domain-containing protein [Oscillospiraceae bacterium]|nr:S1 RNA-binding domain-containing protein [Oscillospiraceae bacterium]